MKNIYHFTIAHPQALGGDLAAGVPANTEEEARELLNKELFFHEGAVVNGYLYSATLDRVDAASAFVRNSIVFLMDDGSTWVKDLDS
jgi:hypothetical protein